MKQLLQTNFSIFRLFYNISQKLPLNIFHVFKKILNIDSNLNNSVINHHHLKSDKTL